MGPSGCGKTTLLNILSGIDEPTSGTVLVNGQPLYGISDDQRTDLRKPTFRIYLPKFQSSCPCSQPLKTLNCPLLAQRSPTRRGTLRLLALEQVGLGDRNGHRPAELSGGQQQRVAVARAIVHRPSIILCDEPTGTSTTPPPDEVMALLSTMNEEQGTTFLIVTHDPAIAEQCQRTITMSDGNIVAPSPPPTEEE